MISSSTSKITDTERARQRVRDALRKAERGEELTKKELMIVQWVISPGGCRACSPGERIVHGTGKGSCLTGGER